MADPLPKLGKLPAKPLRGLPALGKYTLHLPASPPAADYSKSLSNLGEMANNRLGDCTIAAIGHAVQTWTSLTRPVQDIIADSVIVQFYADSCGYVIGDPNTDQGEVETDVLKYWYRHPIDGHHALEGFAGIRPGNRASIRDAIYLFGVAYVGVLLPVAAQQGEWDVSPDDPLTGDNAPGGWGGHALPLISYDQDSLTCITWGKLKKMSWSWADAYMDEGYALLSKDWILNSGKAPHGFDLAALQADMQAIRAG